MLKLLKNIHSSKFYFIFLISRFSYSLMYQLVLLFVQAYQPKKRFENTDSSQQADEETQVITGVWQVIRRMHICTYYTVSHKSLMEESCWCLASYLLNFSLSSSISNIDYHALSRCYPSISSHQIFE